MNTKPIKILLIEDSKAQAHFVQEILQRKNKNLLIKWADTFSKGLQYLSTIKIDVIILDLNLPDSYGFDTFANISKKAPDIPIIIMSGTDDEALAIKIVQKGAQDYLVKGSFDGNLLTRSIQHSIERKHTELELCRLNESLEQRVIERTSELTKANEMLQQKIIERDRIEKALRGSEKILTQIIQGSTIPSFVIDNNHIVTHWNRACENLTGISTEKVIGTKNQWMVGYSEARPVLADLVVGGASEKDIIKLYGNNYQKSDMVEDAYEVECFFPNMGEEGRWLFLTAASFKDIDSNITGAIETLQDITQRKEVENTLQKAKEVAEETNQLKTQFVSNVSHEIRTPLNGIIGFTENIIGANSVEVIHKQAQTILQESRILSNLFTDILDYAIIQDKKFEIDPKPFELRKLLDEIINAFKVKIQSKGLDIKLSIKKDTPQYVIGDYVQIYKVLLKLISNAIKFTEQGSVTVLVEPLEILTEHVKLSFSVIDTGIGIPVEKQESIFQSFQQVDGSMTRKHGGAGLGITLSKELVDLMGGKMDMESTSGEGSTFRFILDLEICSSSSEISKLVTSSDSNLIYNNNENRHTGYILYAEDYEPNQEVMRLHLEKAGHKLDIVENGKQAVAVCEKKKFDLILMDIQMPEMDGIEATGHIRSDKSYCTNTPIVAVTAHTDENTRNKCYDAGINQVIAKPVRGEPLLNVVNNWLTQTNAQIQKKSNDKSSSNKKLVNQNENLPIDYNEALKEFASNKEVLDKVIHQFIKDVEVQIQTLTKALEEGDVEILHKEAHKIYGGASCFTAMQLAGIADQLEILAKSGNLDGGEQLMSEFKKEFNRLKEFVLNNKGC